jgi:hypothetical protein
MRTYTVRRHLADTQQVEIDFALHDEEVAGPASPFAASAQIGDLIGLSGPAASHRRSPAENAWKLVIGDETALPAIDALVESLDPGERAVVYAEVDDHLEEQRWKTVGDVDVHWAHPDDGSGERFAVLADEIGKATFDRGPMFAWVAGEASAVRSLRRHLVEDRGIDKAGGDHFRLLAATHERGRSADPRRCRRTRRASGTACRGCLHCRRSVTSGSAEGNLADPPVPPASGVPAGQRSGVRYLRRLAGTLALVAGLGDSRSST